MNFSAVVPCRAGSVRVPEKNTRPFGPNGESLLELKLRQLRKLEFLNEIIISTNDDRCMDIVRAEKDPRVRLDIRPSNLALSETRLTDLISYVGGICSGEYFLWTHVTSPFFTSNLYRTAYKKFQEVQATGADSLTAVEKIQDFVVDDLGRPMNFGEKANFWPRTQDLKPMFRLTSALFIGATEMMSQRANRIGDRLCNFEVGGPAAIDIDWEDDFSLAVRLAKQDPSLLD